MRQSRRSSPLNQFLLLLLVPSISVALANYLVRSLSLILITVLSLMDSFESLLVLDFEMLLILLLIWES